MAPIIYDRSESGLKPANSDSFGLLGEIQAFTFHHTAGPRADSKARCQELNRQYQLQHISQGWGDIGYHFCMDDHGRIYKLRNVRYKGAHVGGWNTGNVGLTIHGNYMIHSLNEAQRETIEWIFKGGLYVLTNEPEAGYRVVRTHREWPNHTSNLCPGTNAQRHIAWRRSVDFK